jgi:hypothetical protein
MQYKTKFGSLENYEKCGMQVIDGNFKNYAFPTASSLPAGPSPMKM